MCLIFPKINTGHINQTRISPGYIPMRGLKHTLMCTYTYTQHTPLPMRGLKYTPVYVRDPERHAWTTPLTVWPNFLPPCLSPMHYSDNQHFLYIYKKMSKAKHCFCDFEYTENIPSLHSQELSSSGYDTEERLRGIDFEVKKTRYERQPPHWLAP